ncbi:MAG: DUF6131 family protein [Mycobacterium sp.]|uniref:DUF6131 family protein n=1 Tax=Mycobacterium sp. TaxID=1785 RepID=UPI003BAF9D2D
MEGTPFGRYRLIELLGRGGMGEVWRAHDTGTDRIVAIKVLPAHFSDNEEFQRRFRREAHAASRLNTPHVVPIHDYGEIDGRLYVNMRLVEGRDLEAVLAEGPIEPARAVRIIEGVALALHAAHEVGLLHRDVKPSNILLDRNDFAYLIDFGIARAADETRLTKTGNTIGTFHYIAPERLSGQVGEDARADIYALACVLYECLTGRTPFAGDDMARLVAAHLNTPPPQPSTAKPDLPPQLDGVIATGMAKDPDQRYATTVELDNAAHDAITAPLAPPSAPTLLADAPPTTPAPARREDQVPPPPAPDAVRQQPADLNVAATQQRPPDRPPVQQPRPADRPSTEIRTPPPPSEQRPRRRPKWPLIAAIALIVLGLVLPSLVPTFAFAHVLLLLGVMLLVVGLVLMAVGLGTPTGDLTMTERQPPRWETRANHTSSAGRAVGGQLRVAGDTLTFSPHRFDRTLAANNVAIRLADIQAFEVEPVNLGHFFGGGLRKRLAVVTRDGHRELFVVNNLGKTIDELWGLIRQYG